MRLSHEIETAEFILRIQGRIDGLLVSAEEVLLEEIKTVQGGWDRTADPLHWAQAKIYGFIYAQDNALEQITIQLTYLDLDTGEVTEFRERASLWPSCRPSSSRQRRFISTGFGRITIGAGSGTSPSARSPSPFRATAPASGELAVAAYRALARGGRLFLEAPTGIGKTISVLFPAVKALGEGKLERIFYLTARTVGRAVAQKALRRPAPGRAPLAHADAHRQREDLRSGRPALRPGSLPLCSRLLRPLARPAMRAALAREEITRPVLEAVSREHQVCPFELSLDLSSWVDVVVCDYNYVFDPKVYLRRHFAEEPGDYAFLVDEAHNLVDRAREMFSADLDTREIQDVRRALKQAVPRCAKALSR